MLNVLNVITNESATSSSTDIIDSFDLWHVILGHINFAYIKRMKQLGLLSNFSKFEI